MECNNIMITCRSISKGKTSGELLVSNKTISFLGGVNPETGEVIDPNGNSHDGRIRFYLID